MIRLFVLMIVLTPIAAICQTYHPLIRANTYWDVHHGDGSQICNVSGGDQYYFEGDTVIMGIEYAIVRSHPIISLLPVPYCPPFVVDSTTSSIKAFMREDTTSRTVHVFDTNNQSDELLFHFGLQAGDVLNSTYAGQGATLMVDSVGTTILLDGAERNIFYLDNGEYYIESIGGSGGLWFPLIMGLGFWEVPLCVRENGIALWGDQCYGYLGSVGIQSSEQIRIRVYPNPSNGTIQVDTWNKQPITLTLFDTTNQVVLTFQVSNGQVLDLQDLTPEVYLFRLGTEGPIGRLMLVN